MKMSSLSKNSTNTFFVVQNDAPSRGERCLAVLRNLRLLFSSVNPVAPQNRRGGRGGRGRAALRSLRLLFITANSVARMRRLLTELNRGVRTVLPICVAQVLLFETCGSRSLFYDGAVPFQAHKRTIPGRFAMRRS